MSRFGGGGYGDGPGSGPGGGSLGGGHRGGGDNAGEGADRDRNDARAGRMRGGKRSTAGDHKTGIGGRYGRSGIGHRGGRYGSPESTALPDRGPAQVVNKGSTYMGSRLGQMLDGMGLGFLSGLVRGPYRGPTRDDYGGEGGRDHIYPRNPEQPQNPETNTPPQEEQPWWKQRDPNVLDNYGQNPWGNYGHVRQPYFNPYAGRRSGKGYVNDRGYW